MPYFDSRTYRHDQHSIYGGTDYKKWDGKPFVFCYALDLPGSVHETAEQIKEYAERISAIRREPKRGGTQFAVAFESNKMTVPHFYSIDALRCEVRRILLRKCGDNRVVLGIGVNGKIRLTATGRVYGSIRIIELDGKLRWMSGATIQKAPANHLIKEYKIASVALEAAA